MARVMLVWELGGYLGHLASLAELARAFRARGHEVALVARDLRAAQTVFGDQPPCRMLQAPVYPGERVRASRNPVSFAEILHYCGYAEPGALRYLIKAWRDLYALFQPKLLVFDYAPTAQLAARGQGAARVITGQGFLVPPAQRPFPAFTATPRVAPEKLLETEDRLLRTVNGIARTEGLPPLEALHELYQAELTLVTTAPELDPYHDTRGHETYIGPAGTSLPGAAPHWKQAHNRVAAYLKAAHPATGATLEALAALGCEIHAYAPDLPVALARRFQQSNISLHREPLALDAAARSADLLICHGGHGSVSTALTAGCPVLALPMQVEQALLGQRLQDQGLGAWCPPRVAPSDLTGTLQELLNEPAYRQRAQAFSERHAPRQPVAEAIVARSLELLDGESRQGAGGGRRMRPGPEGPHRTAPPDDVSFP